MIMISDDELAIVKKYMEMLTRLFGANIITENEYVLIAERIGILVKVEHDKNTGEVTKIDVKNPIVSKK